MKNKLIRIIMALMLTAAIFCPTAALSEARYPDLRGAVTDDAGVLSQSVANDIAEFQTLALSRTGAGVYVATVHFLDGVDVQTYANTLFDRWTLGEMDFLLVGAAGEDSFASASGRLLKQKLNDNNARRLFTSAGFSELFKAQQYDAAFGKYFVAFSDVLGEQYDTDIRLGKLFSAYQAEAQDQPAATSSPDSAARGKSHVSDMLDRITEKFGENVQSYNQYNERRERENESLSPKGWVVLALLALLVFGRSNPARRARGKSGCAGCGCSPLGWVFGIFGLGALFGRKGRR